mmetsp:Transcript_32354/g.68944  ORF Transcript_32354/g.68944 Transcript_32354/m.68944 type:complete len:299 (-) Transcript_32354:50-946(-)
MPAKAAAPEGGKRKKKMRGAGKKAEAGVKVPAPAEAEEVEEEEADAEESTGRAQKTKAGRFAAMAEDASEEEEEEAEPRGVVYLGHIPKGFFEPQMRKFFGQFGKLTRMRMARSKKNAGSKGYAFLEFAEESVAKIVADTMNGYLLFGKKLDCHLVTKDKQHPKLFKGCRKRMVNMSGLRRRKAASVHNNKPTIEIDGEKVPQLTTRQDRNQSKRQNKLQSLLSTLDIDYDLSLVSGRKKGGAKASATPVAPAAAAEDDKAGKRKRKTPATAGAAVAEVTTAASTAGSVPIKKKRRKA